MGKLKPVAKKLIWLTPAAWNGAGPAYCLVMGGGGATGKPGRQGIGWQWEFDEGPVGLRGLDWAQAGAEDRYVCSRGRGVGCGVDAAVLVDGEGFVIINREDAGVRVRHGARDAVDAGGAIGDADVDGGTPDLGDGDADRCAKNRL